MKWFIVLAICLCGCAKTPTESVIDNHIDHINDVLDYSHNNIEQTKDVIFLQNELKSCQLVLVDTKQTYYGEISTCKAEKRYWQLATSGLVLLLVIMLYACVLRKRF